MKISAVCVILGACSYLHAQDLGRSDPPYVEASVTMPFKFINNAEKRADMVADLAEKSEMNYRLLALKIMEKWHSSVKSDKGFLKDLRKCKTVSFSVSKDGSIVIKGVEDTSASDKAKKSGGKKGPADSSSSSSASAKANSDN